jgi:hypothetical protein
VHNGANHIIFNIVLQIIFGLPLNMVHGSMKFGLIYELGVSLVDSPFFFFVVLPRNELCHRYFSQATFFFSISFSKRLLLLFTS